MMASVHGAGASLRAARLERHIKHRLRPGQAAQVLQGADLGMRLAVLGVEALRHHLAVLDDDGAHHRDWDASLPQPCRASSSARRMHRNIRDLRCR